MITKNYGFYWYNTFYSYVIGTRISGTMGRLQGQTRIIRGKTYYGMTSRLFPKITYYTWKGKQYNRKWCKPTDTITPRRLQERDAMRQGVISWKSLTDSEKKTYKDYRSGHRVMSGYNYFLSDYMKDFLK